MEKFDERQLWIRGKAFQHAYLLLAILVLLSSLYAEAHHGVHLFSPLSEVMVLIMASVMLASIELIYKDAYAANLHNHHLLAIVMMICGGCSIVITLIKLITGKQAMIVNGMLSDTVASLITGLFMSLIGLLYLYAYHKDNLQNENLGKEDNENDENNG